MPTPADPNAAKLVRALMPDGRAALDDLEEGAKLLNADFDCGMKRSEGAAAFGAAFESLADKAGVAFESAAAHMGADKVMFGFFDPRESARDVSHG